MHKSQKLFRDGIPISKGGKKSQVTEIRPILRER